jgi:hypothetical protein
MHEHRVRSFHLPERQKRHFGVRVAALHRCGIGAIPVRSRRCARYSSPACGTGLAHMDAGRHADLRRRRRSLRGVHKPTAMWCTQPSAGAGARNRGWLSKRTASWPAIFHACKNRFRSSARTCSVREDSRATPTASICRSTLPNRTLP